MREMSENGAENLRRDQFSRKELRRDRLSRGPETTWRIKSLFRQTSTWQVGVVFSRPIGGSEAADRPVDRLLDTFQDALLEAGTAAGRPVR
jgi:hypothetical protein